MFCPTLLISQALPTTDQMLEDLPPRRSSVGWSLGLAGLPAASQKQRSAWCPYRCSSKSMSFVIQGEQTQMLEFLN